MYHSHVISGRMLGSFFHWLIRAACFIGLWAVTYGVIWIGKFVIANKILVGSIAGIILLLIIVVRILLWKHSRNELLRVKAEVKENDIEIGVLTIPKTKAVEVANLLVDNGVKAIWNFAPINLKASKDVVVKNEDLSASLLVLLKLLNERGV